MKFLLVIIAAIGVANADTSKWFDFRVKYSGSATGVGRDSFFPIAKTLTDALVAGWVRVTTTNSLGATTVCLTSTDNRICPIYDEKGFIAGMQVAIPPSDVDNVGINYDFSRFPVYEKKTINGVMHWTSTFYIVKPATIQAGGRPSAPTIGEGLWLKSGSSFIEIPTSKASIVASTPYKWQNCLPNMGIHYYHNMTPQLKCEDWHPYFLLVQDGNLIGVGWQVLGKTKFVSRDWYESINRQGVQTVAPLGPTCLYEGVEKHGVISTHMYFVDKPWTIQCKQSTDSVIPIPGLP